MLVFSNAKINIGLNIVQKRPDGFHNLETVFYPIKLSDGLEIIESSEGFQFSNTGLVVDSAPENNLIVKAYNLLKTDFSLPDVKIHLHKVIPFGAGLGGGSSNASFTLKILNEIFELRLTENKLIEYARKLGSDCAFFIKNKPVFAYEKGDKFQEIELNLSDYKIVLVKPDVNVSTKEAYSNVYISKPQFSLTDLVQKPVSAWKNFVFNDFEKNIFPKFKAIEEIKEKLYKSGALFASMSGSGSSVFGIFEKDYKCNNFEFEFKASFVWLSEL